LRSAGDDHDPVKEEGRRRAHATSDLRGIVCTEADGGDVGLARGKSHSIYTAMEPVGQR
jgi:hypothetical protein